jgi:GWxTD domain-containing protein
MTQFAAWIRTPMAQALGWALVHFVWEGVVLAAALLAMLRVFHAAPARRRYALACLALAAMPAAFAITLGVIWALRPLAVAVPIHWVAAPLADGPIAAPARRFAWAMIFDRLAWAVPVWAAGVAFFYARGLAGWVAVRRLRHRGVCVASREWQTRLEQLCARLSISRPVSLLESCFTDAPVLIGYLRPAILLPLGCLTGLSAAQVECILLHELAHVARHDYVVNLLQSLVEGLLFYHPAVWWVSRVVRAERENCCDDRVVETMGDARAYAATLAVLEQRRAPAAALAANGGNLMKRIRRLTTESRGAQTSVAPAASAAVLLVIFAAALTALPAKLPKVRHAHRPAPAPVAMAVAAASPAPQQSAAPLSTPYEKWLREDVVYIITEQERAAFVALTSDAERENFIEQFWQRRDPTPGTPENEFREEHYRRIAYANEHFAGSVAGWKTDRGRTYIVYGPPDEIDDHPRAAATNGPRNKAAVKLPLIHSSNGAIATLKASAPTSLSNL